MNKKYANIALISLLFCTVHNSNSNGEPKPIDIRFSLGKYSKEEQASTRRAANKILSSVLLTGHAISKTVSENETDIEGCSAIFGQFLYFPKDKPDLANPFAEIMGNFITTTILGLIINRIGEKIPPTMADNKTVRFGKGIVAGAAGEELWSRLSRFLVDKGVLEEFK